MSSPPWVTRPIRIGVMANGRRFPRWQAEALRALIALADAEIALLIVRSGGSATASKLSRLRDFGHLLWTLFNKGFVERRSQASAATDMSAELAGVPEISCRTEPAGKYGERFTDADVAAIAEYDLDVILRFSFGIIKGEILHAARYGVWSFHHGDEREYRGRPPGFWELYEGRRVMGSVLQRLTERLDGGVVLHRGFVATTPHSYVRTRDEAFLASAVWPSIVVRQIRLGDTAMVEAAPSTTEAPVRRDPANGVMVRFLWRQAAAFVAAQLRGLLRAAKWSVGVADAPIAAWLSGTAPEVRWMREHGSSRYLADPFAVEHDGRLVALVEDYDYATHRGVVSAVDLDGDGTPQVVLDTGVHASYPYVLEHEGEIYCIPETYQADEVRLYRATDFPTEWTHEATLLTGVAALDPTVFHHDGRWWLFCTDRNDGSNTKLLVFHAEQLTGPWQPHALNPVKTDVRSSRPGGTPFYLEGRLHRPAQDTSSSYGGAISIGRIDELSPTSFSEELVATIAPPSRGRYNDGLHTLSAVGDRTVVDGRRDTFMTSAFQRELSARLGRLRRRS